MTRARYPSLYQVNTRLRLAQLAGELGRPATLDDITDHELEWLKDNGFDLVWFLGVWQTGEAARQVSASNPEWLAEYYRILPDFQVSDVCGSCFAIQDYHVHRDFGGDQALAGLRQRLNERGMRLILDFVPNHVALDHHWVSDHPDYIVAGTEELLASQPQNYTRLDLPGGSRILAYGRDPYFSGWPDTLQLNYGNPALQEALLAELLRIAGQCDGVRCDMAMLVLPEIFEKTWGVKPAPFWPRAIQAVRESKPNFLFMAEVYWDLEWTLQQQGFDFTYDKRLYDRLVQREALPVRSHLLAGLEFQDHLARFLENHDEPRAAAAFPLEVHRAAALITYLTPGLRFFHLGQREGKRARIPTHLGRAPDEPPDATLVEFYDSLMKLLNTPLFRDGSWQLLDTQPAWDGNGSHMAFLAWAWSGPTGSRCLVVVNYAGHHSQCYIRLSWGDLKGQTWRLRDRLSLEIYDRNGEELIEKGLYLDVPPWGYHAFDLDLTQ